MSVLIAFMKCSVNIIWMYWIKLKNQINFFLRKYLRNFDKSIIFGYNIYVILYFIYIKMKETFQSTPDMELAIQNSLEERRDELKWLESEIESTWTEITESTEAWLEWQFPPTDSFWWIKLSKTKTYNVPWVEKRLAKTEDWATNPEYEKALVMKQNGKTYRATHKETYYTDKNRHFPVKNIEWRIRSVLNKDRKRNSLPEIPEWQKVWQYGEDWTIRDMNWYIIIAANLDNYPRGTIIMTTLWPGRVYDTWRLTANHIDIYTHW